MFLIIYNFELVTVIIPNISSSFSIFSSILINCNKFLNFIESHGKLCTWRQNWAQLDLKKQEECRTSSPLIKSHLRGRQIKDGEAQRPYLKKVKSQKGLINQLGADENCAEQHFQQVRYRWKWIIELLGI